MTEIDTYQNGNFKLEEWEDVNYCEHSFYKNDEGLTDEEVVDLLNEQEERIQELEQEKQDLKNNAKILVDYYSRRYANAIYERKNIKECKSDLWVVKEVLCNLRLYDDGDVE